jgi:hypothetical protein
MENLVKEHIKKFGVKPKVIGMFWNRPERLADGIADAIEDGKPYDEYEKLSKDQKKAYNDGGLVF